MIKQKNLVFTGKFGQSFALTALLFTLALPCFAIDQAGEIEELKRGQETILKELQEIKNLILSQKVPAPVPAQQQPPQQLKPSMDIRGLEFELYNGLMKGDQNAKLVVIEFTDYQCPYCGSYARETYPMIEKQYVNTGKIRYAVVDNPLPFHTLAPKAAEAARCAKDQGKYWEMHEQIMADQGALDNLPSYASKIRLNVKVFQDCLDTGKYAAAIKSDMNLASALRMVAVPGFVVAVVDQGNPGKLWGISSIQGALPFAIFQQLLDQALNEAQRD